MTVHLDWPCLHGKHTNCTDSRNTLKHIECYRYAENTWRDFVLWITDYKIGIYWDENGVMPLWIDANVDTWG